MLILALTVPQLTLCFIIFNRSALVDDFVEFLLNPYAINVILETLDVWAQNWFYDVSSEN